MSTNNDYIDKKLMDFATESYESPDKWEKARDSNKEIVGAKMRINENKTESWVCEKCKHIIVMNINGNRAKMKVGKNTQVYVKFSEMAAWCEDCKEFNHISLSHIIDDKNNQDTSFIEDKIAAEKEIDNKTCNDPSKFEKYFLKLND